MTTMTAPPELTEDAPTAQPAVMPAAPRRSGWNDENHGLWGLVRDPEAVLLPHVLGAMAVGMAVFDDQPWFVRAGREYRPQFDDVQRAIDAQEGPRQLVPQLYFAGGVTVLAVLAVLGVLIALCSRTVGVAVRRMTIGVAALGIAATVGAARLDGSGSLGSWLDRADAAYWLALGGFVLLLLAAVIVRPRAYVTEE